ncbi:MAG: Vgb family protein [Streptosporangiaceae bacterium]
MAARVPRLVILAGAVLLAAAGCETGSGAGSGSGGGPVSPSASAPGRSQAARIPAYVHLIRTGGRPCAVLGAAGAIWVADLTGNRVLRLDPASGAVTARIPAGLGPCGMAFGAGAVWVEDYSGNSVTRIDVRTLRTRRYPAGSSPYDVTFAAGAAWVTSYGDDAVTRVDAVSGRTRTIPVGVSPEGIAKAAGAVWVANYGSGTVSRIGTATLRVRTIRTGGSPAWTAYAGSTVWVGDQSTGDVLRINARTGSVTARVKVGRTPNDGDVLGRWVWFPDKDGSLYRISTAGGRASGPYPLPAANPFTLAGYAGRLWIADFGGTSVLVVNPAKLPVSGGPGLVRRPGLAGRDRRSAGEAARVVAADARVLEHPPPFHDRAARRVGQVHPRRRRLPGARPVADLGSRPAQLLDPPVGEDPLWRC